MATPEELWEKAAPADSAPVEPKRVPSTPMKWEDAKPSGGEGKSEGMTNPVVPLTSGSRQYAADVAQFGAPSAGMAAEVGLRRAANSALYNIPDHLLTWGRMMMRGEGQPVPEEREAVAQTQRLQNQKLPRPGSEEIFQRMVPNIPSVAEPYYKEYAKTKAELEGKSRLEPAASDIGTGAGFLGGMAVPLGPVKKPGEAIGAGAQFLSKKFFSPETAKSIGNVVEAGATGALVSGGSSFIEEPDVKKALFDAGVGAVASPVIQKSVSALVGKLKGYPDPAPNGNWTPEAQQAIDEAFWPAIQAGRMTMDELDALKPRLIEVFKAKGISTPAAKEALLKEAGAVDPTRAQTTGKIPTTGESSLPEVIFAGQQAQNDVLSKLSSGIPTAPTMPNVTAQRLFEAEQKARNSAKAPYKAIEKEPGWFMAGVFNDDIQRGAMRNLNEELKASNMPTDFRDLPQYPKAKEAYDLIVNTLASGRMPDIGNTQGYPTTRIGDPQPISAESLMMVRKGINKLWSQASEQDRVAIDAIRRGFDKNTENAIVNGLFTGDGAKILRLMRQADSGWAQYKTLFSGPDSADKVVKSAVEKMRAGDSAEVAQGILNAKMTGNNALGPSVYAKLETILGKQSSQMQEVRDALRASVMNTTQGVKGLANNIDEMLAPGNKKLYEKLFSRDEIRQLRITSEALRVLDKKPLPAKEANERVYEVIMRHVPTSMSRMMSGMAGGVIGSSMHPLGGFVGAAFGATTNMLGDVTRKMGDKIGRSREIKRELSGAPARPLNADELVSMPKAAVPSTFYPVQIPTGYAEPSPLFPEPPRSGRATGGRVSDRLVAEVDRAKKRINNQTEELLKTPDTHVAQALEVANRHLEG